MDDIARLVVVAARRGAANTPGRAPVTRASIPPKTNRKGSFSFSGWVYRQQNLVERFFNRIKHFRGIATLLQASGQLPRRR